MCNVMDIICGTYQYGLYEGVPPKPLERLSQSIVFESLSLLSLGL